MLLYLTFARIKTVECRLYLARKYVGKKTQSTHVHTNDRRTLGAHPASSLEEGAIATHRDDVIHIEVIIFKDACRPYLLVLHLGEEVVEETFNIHFCILFVEVRKDSHDGSRLLSLVFIAKYCEF